MNSITKQNEDFFNYVKSIILKYCPYTENRLSILGNAKATQIDIQIYIDNNESLVMFLIGNSSSKKSIPEKVIIPHIIDFKEIEKIINFILKDHEVIRNIYFNNNEFNLEFAINWTNKSVKGINCGDIGLSLNFENIELEYEYLYLLFQKYYTYLEIVPSFIRIKNQYINNAKQTYFNTLEKLQLISFLNQMNENELKELLYTLDNDIFIKYTTDIKQKPESKKLFLEKSKTL